MASTMTSFSVLCGPEAASIDNDGIMELNSYDQSDE